MDESAKTKVINIAVVGCSHGEIDRIYEVIQKFEVERQIKVQLVLCCGDFQSVRNMTDLRCMNCPIKYQAMHDFHRYYSGERQAPIPTIFIGGNHEASNFLQELPFGGWVAPNIYFSGYSNVLRFGPLRIAAISGIFKGQDYLKGRYECPPYDQNTIRSTYHYRNLDIFRLKQIRSQVDIMLSHDWPRGVYHFGNTQQLLRRKPFFREEVERNELGSRPLSEVLSHMHPSFWFSAHLHVQFDAIIPHNSEPGVHNVKETKFLALDKVLPRRHFLQVIDIPISSDEDGFKLSYDPEWLAILKSTDHLMTAKSKPCFMPGPGFNARFDFTPTDEEIEGAVTSFLGQLLVPEIFYHTGPKYVAGERPGRAFPVVNPQTTEFCTKLGVTDPINLLNQRQTCQINEPSRSSSLLGADSSQSSNSFREYSSPFSSFNSTMCSQNTSTFSNPDEIVLDLDEECPEETANVSNLDLSASRSNSRTRMQLPPPILASTPSKPSKKDGRCADLNEDSNKNKELELLADVLGATSQNIPEDSPGPLFLIDKAGTKSDCQAEEPELKRKRNQALFDALESETQ